MTLSNDFPELKLWLISTDAETITINKPIYLSLELEFLQERLSQHPAPKTLVLGATGTRQNNTF
jgi:hypothetical protein